MISRDILRIEGVCNIEIMNKLSINIQIKDKVTSVLQKVISPFVLTGMISATFPGGILKKRLPDKALYLLTNDMIEIYF